MKKYFVLLLALVAASALAETDYVAGRRLDSIRDGKPNDDKIRKLLVDGTATIGGATTIGGALTVSGALSAGSVAGSDLTYAASTVLNVTNGQAVTLTSGAINVLAPVGGTNNAAAAITLAPAAAADLRVPTWILVSTNVAAGGPTTNTLAIEAASANYAGVAVEAAIGGMVMVVPMSTTAFYAK